MSEDQEMEALGPEYGEHPDVPTENELGRWEADVDMVAAPANIDHNALALAAIRIGKDGIEALKSIQQMSYDDQDRLARRRFYDAFARFKELCPAIPHNRTSDDARSAGNKFTWTWADMGQISRIADPVLGQCGLSYRFEKRSVDGKDEMFCIVSGHGHSEESSFPVIADKGSMNPIQQVISGRSYAKRIALQDALSIAPEHAEAGDPIEAISEDQAANLQSLCDETKTKYVALAQTYGVEKLDDIPLINYDAAVRKLETLRKRAPAG